MLKHNNIKKERKLKKKKKHKHAYLWEGEGRKEGKRGHHIKPMDTEKL